MRANYDFSKAVRNPYAKQLKKQLTIRLDEDTIHYFQNLSTELGIPYQTLMNMYLRECAETGKRPHWVASPSRRANLRLQRPAAARKRATRRR
jgi:antitoxin component of RelBE/YafQ-DinJ toxin-antitoxin module